MTFVFWFSLLALVYAFIGYPLLVRLAAALWGRTTLKDENHTPTVSVPWAVVVEAGEDDAEAELKRQTRIMAQSWHVCLRHLGKLIREFRVGFVWQVLSHKILRWLALPLLAGLAVNALFGAFDMYSMLTTIGLIIFLGLAWFGSRGADGIAKVVWMFVVLHWAAVLGLCRLAKGEMFIMWNPRNS
jgi:hypothetical protein